MLLRLRCGTFTTTSAHAVPAAGANHRWLASAYTQSMLRHTCPSASVLSSATGLGEIGEKRCTNQCGAISEVR